MRRVRFWIRAVGYAALLITFLTLLLPLEYSYTMPLMLVSLAVALIAMIPDVWIRFQLTRSPIERLFRAVGGVAILGLALFFILPKVIPREVFGFPMLSLLLLLAFVSIFGFSLGRLWQKKPTIYRIFAAVDVGLSVVFFTLIAGWFIDRPTRFTILVSVLAIQLLVLIGFGIYEMWTGQGGHRPAKRIFDVLALVGLIFVGVSALVLFKGITSFEFTAEAWIRGFIALGGILIVTSLFAHSLIQTRDDEGLPVGR